MLPVEPRPAATPRPRTPRADAVLYLDGVSVVFDGFRALNNLSLIVAQGELRAVIGPNGAGKTTMMDVITGKTRPTEGVVQFRDIDLTRLDEAAIANLGIGRKFQKPTVFDALTVFENLELALKAPRDPWSCFRWRLSGEARGRIEAVLAEIGLAARAEEPAAILSHGQRQWLEIGMLLMQDPEVLLVDEPVAGMTDQETEHTAALLRRI
ncbi:MAG: ATP-binding cassette domain-containing protein, partial [Acetobacteraceae bacterium]|nr:ATP-binding cassette domain-containing protein [Acetobacteraceae bacterium]